MRCSPPKEEGFYWAIWRKAAEGTDHCRNCGHRHSEWTEPNGLDIETWCVVEVVENSLDHNDPEHFMVQVPGVSNWQPFSGFDWGPAVEPPEPADKQGVHKLRRLLKELDD